MEQNHSSQADKDAKNKNGGKRLRWSVLAGGQQQLVGNECQALSLGVCPHATGYLDMKKVLHKYRNACDGKKFFRMNFISKAS